MALTTASGTVTAGVSNHLKGAYTQLFASTPYASSRLYLMVQSTNLGNIFGLLDLATGAAGSETVVVSNMAYQTSSGDFLCGAVIPISVDIPAGTRVAIRGQSATGSSVVGVVAYLDNRPLASVTAPVTYGAVTASSRGTQIDPGAVANTKSAYVQFSASTTARIDTLIVCGTVGATAINIPSLQTWVLDVATGAAGSEVIVVPDLQYVGNANGDMAFPPYYSVPVSIAAGTRLAARAACTSISASPRLLSVTLIGMQDPATSSGGVFPIFGGSVLR